MHTGPCWAQNSPPHSQVLHLCGHVFCFLLASHSFTQHKRNWICWDSDAKINPFQSAYLWCTCVFWCSVSLHSHVVWIHSRTCVFSLHKHRFRRAFVLDRMLMHMFLGCSWRWRIDLTAAWPRIIMQALCVPARIEAQNCPQTAFDDRLHFDSTLRPLSPPPRCMLSCPVCPLSVSLVFL